MENKKYKPLLKSFNLNTDIFDTIINKFGNIVVYVDNIHDYYYGSTNKRMVYVSKDKQYLVCRQIVLYYVMGYSLEGVELWKQVRIRRVLDNGHDIEHNVSGTYAYNYMMKLLKKFYTREEIDQCLLSHVADVDNTLKQQHYEIPVRLDAIYKFDDCIEYDINGAHCDAICEIFPKAKNDINKLYKLRKQKPVYKQIFNYFVGMLGSLKKNKGKYRGTYLWIVHRTTKMLEKRISAVGGRIIYLNTDGVVLQHPKNLIADSRELGDFKIEYRGPIYIARTKNSCIKQIGDTLKGNVPTVCRKDIDLANGKMVEYDNKNDVLLGGSYKVVHREIKNAR